MIEKSGRGPFFGSLVLALATITFNFMAGVLANTFFNIFQTVTLILFLVTVIYTFTETMRGDLLRQLSWMLIIFVFVFNVLISFLYGI